LAQLQNVRSCQNNSKELYEAQIRNLTELIDDKDHEIENIKASEKLEKNRLQDGIRALEKEISYCKNAHAL
jgi:hypothetical protein